MAASVSSHKIEKKYDGPTNVVTILVKRQICNILKYEEVMNKQILQTLCAQVQEWKLAEQQNIRIRVESNLKILKIS